MYLDDKTRVQHMLDASQNAILFVKGKSVEHLRRDLTLALAVVKCVEMVGEAGFKISRNLRDAHPEIPWQTLIGLRNHLVHEYHDIDFEQVWDTVTSDLPPLIPDLQALIDTLNKAGD